jgi:hypothetical protein
MGDRHKNFEDSMLSVQDIRKTKYHHLKLLRFFLKRPVDIYKSGILSKSKEITRQHLQNLREV